MQRFVLYGYKMYCLTLIMEYYKYYKYVFVYEHQFYTFYILILTLKSIGIRRNIYQQYYYMLVHYERSSINKIIDYIIYSTFAINSKSNNNNIIKILKRGFFSRYNLAITVKIFESIHRIWNVLSITSIYKMNHLLLIFTFIHTIVK